MQQKSLLPLTLFMILIMALAGCRRTLPPPEPPEFEGTTLKIACPRDLAAMIAVQSRPWQNLHNASVVTVPYDPAKGPESVKDADVWVINPADLPHHAFADRLLPLPERFTDFQGQFNWGNLLPAYREQLLFWGKSAYGVPLVGEAPICVYRADLYADPVHQKAFAAMGKRLQAPATWDEFAEQAEYFRAHHPLGKNLPSLAALPEGRELDRLFYTVAASYARRAVGNAEPRNADYEAEVFAFHYDLNTGLPRIDSPGFVAALKMLQRLQACRGKGNEHEEPILGIVEASWLARMQQGPLRDRYSVTTIPGASFYFTPKGEKRPVKQGANRVPYLGGAGWLMVVPRTASHQEASFDLLMNLCGPERGANRVLDPQWSGPVRQDQLSRDRWDAFELNSKRTLALREAVGWPLRQHGIKNPVYCLRLPDQADHRAALDLAIRAAVLKNGDAEKALKEVARKWRALDAAVGVDKQKDLYRRSLGLK